MIQTVQIAWLNCVAIGLEFVHRQIPMHLIDGTAILFINSITTLYVVFRFTIENGCVIVIQPDSGPVTSYGIIVCSTLELLPICSVYFCRNIELDNKVFEAVRSWALPDLWTPFLWRDLLKTHRFKLDNAKIARKQYSLDPN